MRAFGKGSTPARRGGIQRRCSTTATSSRTTSHPCTPRTVTPSWQTGSRAFTGPSQHRLATSTDRAPVLFPPPSFAPPSTGAALPLLGSPLSVTLMAGRACEEELDRPRSRTFLRRRPQPIARRDAGRRGVRESDGSASPTPPRMASVRRLRSPTSTPVRSPRSFRLDSPQKDAGLQTDAPPSQSWASARTSTSSSRPGSTASSSLPTAAPSPASKLAPSTESRQSSPRRTRSSSALVPWTLLACSC